MEAVEHRLVFVFMLKAVEVEAVVLMVVMHAVLLVVLQTVVTGVFTVAVVVKTVK
jgi:hypothetical protein